MRAWIPALLLLGACRPPEPAPDDLDGLLHYLWRKHDDGLDAEIGEAVDHLHAAVDAGALDEGLDGSVSDLSRDELALAGLDRSIDPSEAVGLYVVTPLPCDLDTVERIVTAREQDVLYDVFDSYQREFTSSRAAWDDGAATLGWEVTYTTAVPLAGTYTADLAGGARRVQGASSHGDVLLARSVLVEPAAFEDPDHVFDQDWRIETWWEARPGTVIHAEGLWRHMDAGPASTDSTTVQRLILGGLADWDEQTAHWCTEGLPEDLE